MKNIYLIIIGLALGMFSCDQDNMGTIYEPGAPYVAFSTEVVAENILSAENNYSVNVQLVRSDLSGTETAEIQLEMNEDIDGVFELESNTVSFEDGKGTAYVKIVPVVAPSEIDPTKSYVFNLTITSGNASEFYNTTTYKASFKYTPVGTGNFVSLFYEDEWPVEIEKLEVGELILYKAKGLYQSGYDVTFIVDGETVTVNDQAAWNYDAEYGDVHVTGEGSISGKTITIDMTHFIPEVYEWDPTTETLTLP